MTNSQRLETIRRHLQAWFATETGGQQPWDASESILIRDGFYCGRCFQMSGFRAVWFFEEDQVKIYRSTGELLATFRGNELNAVPIDEPTLNLEQARKTASEKEATQEANEASPVRRAA